jgi:16S rRNA (uracil1498-N3)-methyltransferase
VVIKKDKLEWVVQKAVELGVTKIIPVISARSEKKDINLNRLNKISIEASEQCGRQDLVEIYQPIKFKDALKQVKGWSFLANFDGDNFIDCLKLTNKDKTKPINIFIGPEGGFAEVEIELAKKNNIKIISFGDNILRSETAALVGLTLITNF